MNLHNEIVSHIIIVCIQLGFIKLWMHISLLIHLTFLFNSTIHSSNKKPRINHFYEYSSDFAFISKIIMIMKIFNECLIFWKYSIFTRRNEYNRDFFSSSFSFPSFKINSNTLNTMFSSFSNYGTPSLVKADLSRTRNGRVGLNNLGNTCYMNTGLQVYSLFHVYNSDTHPLCTYFMFFS